MPQPLALPSCLMCCLAHRTEQKLHYRAVPLLDLGGHLPCRGCTKPKSSAAPVAKPSRASAELAMIASKLGHIATVAEYQAAMAS